MNKTIRKSKTIEEFEQVHGAPKIRALEKRLAEEHAKVEALAEVQGKTRVVTEPSCRIRFALIGDTHFGSLYAHTEALHAFYDYAEQTGCNHVYHAGDVLDGHRVYRGQEFELRDIGLEAQVRRASMLPRGLPTSFITGNHDQSFKTAAGAPTGKLIAEATGWNYLGEEQARVEWQTPNGTYSMMIVHPGGGAKAYALSYPAQQAINALEGGSKPNLWVAGHYHKSALLPSYRNVCGVLVGAFQKQTPFMARQGLAAHVGGWVMDITVGDNHNVVRAEFVAFYT